MDKDEKGTLVDVLDALFVPTSFVRLAWSIGDVGEPDPLTGEDRFGEFGKWGVRRVAVGLEVMRLWLYLSIMAYAVNEYTKKPDEADAYMAQPVASELEMYVVHK